MLKFHLVFERSGSAKKTPVLVKPCRCFRNLFNIEIGGQGGKFIPFIFSRRRFFLQNPERIRKNKKNI